MNRRRFFQATGATALALSLPFSAQAMEADKQVLIDAAISSNHGHALSLSIGDVVEMLSKTKQGQNQEISIQGQSGHPHSVSLNQEMLLALLIDQELEVESSVDAGHSHGVLINLEVVTS